MVVANESPLNDSVVGISISDSPDLPRLGLLERHVRLTFAAIVTGLVARGARIAYGGNLDRRGFTYDLFPCVSEAYRSMAERNREAGFLHFIAQSVWASSGPEDVARHALALGGFGEARLVQTDADWISLRRVERGILVTIRRDAEPELLEKKGEDPKRLLASYLSSAARWEMPKDVRRSLSEMRAAMERECSARVFAGGRITGYSGAMPGLMEEALAALEQDHPVVVLGAFGGCAREIAVALNLLPRSQSLHAGETDSGFRKALALLRDRVPHQPGELERTAAFAEDPERIANATIGAFIQALAKRPSPNTAKYR